MRIVLGVLLGIGMFVTAGCRDDCDVGCGPVYSSAPAPAPTLAMAPAPANCNTGACTPYPAF